MFDKKSGNLLDLAINDLNFYQFEDVDYQKKKRDDELAINEAYYAQIDTELQTRRQKRMGQTNLNNFIFKGVN